LPACFQFSSTLSHRSSGGGCCCRCCGLWFKAFWGVRRSVSRLLLLLLLLLLPCSW